MFGGIVCRDGDRLACIRFRLVRSAVHDRHRVCPRVLIGRRHLDSLAEHAERRPRIIRLRERHAVFARPLVEQFVFGGSIRRDRNLIAFIRLLLVGDAVLDRHRIRLRLHRQTKDTKTDGVEVIRRLGSGVGRRTAKARVGAPIAAADHAARARGVAGRIRRVRRVVCRAEPVEAPFLHVPMHVVQPPVARPVASDLRGPVSRFAVLRRIIPPFINWNHAAVEPITPDFVHVGIFFPFIHHILARIQGGRRARAAGVLPLGLRWKVEHQPRLVPQDAHERRLIHRVGIRPASARIGATDHVIGDLLYGAGRVIVVVVEIAWPIFLPHDVFPLLLRAFEHADVERLRERHLVLDFVVPVVQLVLRRAHYERPFGDVPQPQLRRAAGVFSQIRIVVRVAVLPVILVQIIDDEISCPFLVIVRRHGDVVGGHDECRFRGSRIHEFHVARP